MHLIVPQLVFHVHDIHKFQETRFRSFRKLSEHKL